MQLLLLQPPPCSHHSRLSSEAHWNFFQVAQDSYQASRIKERQFSPDLSQKRHRVRSFSSSPSSSSQAASLPLSDKQGSGSRISPAAAAPPATTRKRNEYRSGRQFTRSFAGGGKELTRDHHRCLGAHIVCVATEPHRNSTINKPRLRKQREMHALKAPEATSALTFPFLTNESLRCRPLTNKRTSIKEGGERAEEMCTGSLGGPNL